MVTLAQMANLTDPGSPKHGAHFFRLWMPYLFQRVKFDGVKHAFIPLNRNYKPLGQLDKEFVDYDALALTHGVAFSRDPATFRGIWFSQDNKPLSSNTLWLYNDNPKSRLDYFSRLERLMSKSMPVLGVRQR